MMSFVVCRKVTRIEQVNSLPRIGRHSKQVIQVCRDLHSNTVLSV